MFTWRSQHCNFDVVMLTKVALQVFFLVLRQSHKCHSATY